MILALIPARGGSKGVPRKNLRQVAGKPLIAWSIEAARNSRLVDKVAVSTEDEEIASVARAFGADVVIRPADLATDEASTLGVLRHAIGQIPCDTLVLLQPTSPIRRAGMVDECIREFQNDGADSLATGWWCKYTEYASNTKRRQDIEGFFYDDGNVYVIKGDLLAKGERYGSKIVRKVVSREENLDVDDEFDLWMAEKILTERIKG